MLINICMKFHEGTLNSFWVTHRTPPYRKIYYFQFQRAITPKIRNRELRFLHSARRLMLLYICVKFHENISNRFWVTERTRFCDRQTTRAKTICLPTLRCGGGGGLDILSSNALLMCCTDFTYLMTENMSWNKLQNISWLSSSSIQMLKDFTQAKFWNGKQNF